MGTLVGPPLSHCCRSAGELLRTDDDSSDNSAKHHCHRMIGPGGLLHLSRCLVYDGWPLRQTVERFHVSHTTAAHYRALGVTGMGDHPQPGHD